MKIHDTQVDEFGLPILVEMANVPPRVHGLGVDVKLQLLQPGKRVHQHAERVKVFRGDDPYDKELSFVVALREDPQEIALLAGNVFLSKKEFDAVIQGIRKYRVPFIIFWYSPGMDLDQLKERMKLIDSGVDLKIPEEIRERMGY